MFLSVSQSIVHKSNHPSYYNYTSFQSVVIPVLVSLEQILLNSVKTATTTNKALMTDQFLHKSKVFNN